MNINSLTIQSDTRGTREIKKDRKYSETEREKSDRE